MTTPLLSTRVEATTVGHQEPPPDIPSIGLPFLAADDRPPCVTEPDPFDASWHVTTEGGASRGKPGSVHEAVTAAIRLCAGCPFVQACGEWAITTEEPAGIWGGLTPNRRTRIRNKMTRAAA